MTTQLGLGDIRPDADDPQERNYQGCIPVDYCEEWSPPLRARPDDWIAKREGDAATFHSGDYMPAGLGGEAGLTVIAGATCEFVFIWKVGVFHLSMIDDKLDGAPNVDWNRAHAVDDNEAWCDNESDLIATLKEWGDETPDGFAFTFYFDDWRPITLTGNGAGLHFPIPDSLPGEVTDIASAPVSVASETASATARPQPVSEANTSEEL